MSKLTDSTNPPIEWPPITETTDKPSYDPAFDRFDPLNSRFDRMNSTQLRNYRERQSHQFADSIGGCSSNYRG